MPCKGDKKMTAYAIDYTIKGKNGYYNKVVDAKDLKSAKKKIGKSHKFKDGRMIQIQQYCIIGYF